MTVAFFGHRRSPSDLSETLERVVIRLIEQGANRFYVGNQGSFDDMVLGVLKKLRKYILLITWLFWLI